MHGVPGGSVFSLVFFGPIWFLNLLFLLRCGLGFLTNVSMLSVERLSAEAWYAFQNSCQLSDSYQLPKAPFVFVPTTEQEEHKEPYKITI